MIEITPTRMELYDSETQDLVAVIEMFDEGASSVGIKTVVNPDSWPALSNAILAALKQMHPKSGSRAPTTKEQRNGR